MERVKNSDEVRIPKNSFTAFRLTYQNSQQISESSRCVLLGRVPYSWLQGEQKGYVNGSHLARSTIKKKFRATMATVNRSIRSQNGGSGDGVMLGGTYQGKTNRFLQSLLTAEVSESVNDTYSDNDNDIDNDNDNETTLPGDEYGGGSNESHESLDIKKYSPARPGLDPDDRDSTVSASSLLSLPLENHYKSPVKSYFETNKNADLPVQRVNGATPATNHDSFLFRHSFTSSMHSEASTTMSRTSSSAWMNPMVGDNASSFKTCTKANSNSISLAMPNPTTIVPERILEAEKKFDMFKKRFKHLARSSKGAAKKKGNDFRSRVFKSFLKHFNAGEIIKIDKMLVMVKQAYSFTHLNSFTEDEPCDARVYDRWKEYYVALRKTDDDTVPLCLQLFDSQADPALEKPVYSLKLLQSSATLIYNELDRTISITVPQEHGDRIYILNCGNASTALRWLYFLKQYLGYPFKRTVDISIPNLNLAVSVNLPDAALLNLLKNENTFAIKVLPKGYRVEPCFFISHLQKNVVHELAKLKDVPKVATFLSSLESPWFCFKVYDRLHWVQNNSLVFFMQNQLKSDFDVLEFREKTFVQTYATDPKGNLIPKPTPVEGFLSRLTNIAGNEKYLLRTVHKMSYFFSCDNILFFTKFFRGVPPSPGNCLMNEGADRAAVDRLPIVYEHNPFEIDDNAHLVWLNQDSFEENDQLALLEFERRCQQVIGAGAMIDMRRIKEVRVSPMNKNRKAHNLLICMIWYSNPHLLNDDSIIDSCFEIEMENGGVIKLQAPSRIVRDEWIARLRHARDYWSAKYSNDLNSVIDTRMKNKANLRIDEYVDSNIFHQCQPVETSKSHADATIYNMECISMSSSVMMSGYLYQKHKKHSNFNQYYVVLCPGFLLVFSLYKRSKVTGVWKKNSYFTHYLTIPIADCYVYSGNTTALDLLDRQHAFDASNPGHHSVPRLYMDGWKSSEEEAIRCFTIWFGKKRTLVAHDKAIAKAKLNIQHRSNSQTAQKNPGIVKMVRKLGITGRSIVFMARSRQERELWVHRILTEIDRFAKNE